MLFAVEGGGFFSSSAKGYSKGLTLLLLGQRNEEKPMKITPWSQYQLVEQEGFRDFQLASRKSRVTHRCASFVCFGCASVEADSSFPPKVGPVQQPEHTESPLASDNNVSNSSENNVDESERKSCLKSTLKRPRIVRQSNEVESISGITARRKVQWTDASGSELFQIREFECRANYDGWRKEPISRRRSQLQNSVRMRLMQGDQQWLTAVLVSYIN